MPASGSTVPQLLYDAPSVILAALAVAVVVRAMRDAVLSRRPQSLPGRILQIITDPVVRPVRGLTPRIVPTGFVYFFAICWLTAARMLWLIAGAALGLRSGFGG